MVNLDLLLESDGLFRTTFPDGRSFCWRLLTLKEYKVFRGLGASGAFLPTDIYLMVFKRCYVGDSKLLSNNLPVGMLISIGELIMWFSGDCESTTLRDDVALSRAYYPGQNVQEHMKRVIWTAFPSYTIDEVESWTRPQLIKNFAIAESVMVNRHEGFQMLNVSDIQFDHELQEEQRGQSQKLDIQKIDFDQENKDILQSTSHWDREDVLNEEAKSKQKKQTISPEQARKLDRRRR